jgi:hypothetical protein
MATIQIVAWKDHFVGGTGWDTHAKSEFRKRLRRGIEASPSEIRRLARRVDAREIVCLSDVHDEAVHGLTQMLQTMGADFRVTLEDANSERLFRRTPRR